MVKILHLYHDLMNLYGEWANVDILVRALKARGREPVVKKKSVGEKIDFKKYKFIYIGSGTERSQRACMRDLRANRGALIECIEEGAHVLATGNSHELFGESVTTKDGERYEALRLLPFDTIQTDARVTGDCVYTAPFIDDAKLIGFVNRAGGGQIEKAQAPERPFVCEMGPGASDDMRPEFARAKSKNPQQRAEGIRYKNLLGTYLTGPVLVRNPPLLAHIADALSDGSPACITEDLQLFECQASSYRAALAELTA